MRPMTHSAGHDTAVGRNQPSSGQHRTPACHPVHHVRNHPLSGLPERSRTHEAQVKDIRDSFVYLTPGQRIIIVPLDLIAGSDERSTGGVDGWQRTSPRILNALKHSLKPDQAISSTLSNLARRGWRVLVWSPVDVTECLKAWRMEGAESVSQLPPAKRSWTSSARADRLAVAGHRIISVDELQAM